MKNISDLERDYNFFKKIPFPLAPSDNEELEDLFSELVLQDSYIAGAIEKMILKKKIDNSELYLDDTILDRLENIPKEQLNKKNRNLVNSYILYFHELKKIINSK